MIYDCFTFFNELELLELRLNELDGIVDKFVLVEATKTFSNKPKPLYFQENRARFAAFENKIIHVVVEDAPDTSDAWAIERFQRNAIERGLRACKPSDWVLVSDLDEIPRATAVKKMSCEIRFHAGLFSNAVHAALNSRAVKNIFRPRGLRMLLRKNHPFVLKFEQAHYHYHLNCAGGIWHGTRMMRFRDFSCAEEMRHSGYKVVKDGGWHFTYMGGVDRVREKIAAYAHQEFNTPQLNNAQAITERIHDRQLAFVRLDDSFPLFVREHPEKFSAWIKTI
jgi:hypothetical protein